MRVLVQIASLGAAACAACAAERDLSPAALAASADGKRLYAACETDGSVQVFDTEAEKVVARYAVEQVGALALAPDGRRLYATAGAFGGSVVELDAASGKALRAFPAGHTPVAPVVSADGRTLFYCNRFARADQPDVQALDLATGRLRASAKAIREPVAARLSKDGKELWVVNLFPLMPANSKYVFSSLNVYRSDTLEKVAVLDLPPGAYAARDAAVSPDGKYLFVSHILGRFTVPTTHLDRGWISTSAVSIFDMGAHAYVNTVLLDDTMKGAANPWGLALSADGAWLCVNASGTHELIAVSVKEMLKRLAAAANPKEVVNDLAFLYGAKTRVPLEGQGARALAVCGNRVYSAMYFTDSLNLVELWDDGPGAAVPLALGPARQPGLARRGEMAFNDASLCYQQWLSCSTCHPDTRSDGTNWDLLNDGIGNPKQSRSMLYTHRTSPVMITGVRASAEIAVLKGFTMIQFHEVPEGYLESVNEYLKTLKPVPSPYLKPDGTLTDSARRGKLLFEGKAACATCHTPPYYGDKKKYALGLGSDAERSREFCTPILTEVWRTAPYMYDGRAVTIKDVITTDNVNDKHGHTKDLSPQEVDDLANYVNSL